MIYFISTKKDTRAFAAVNDYPLAVILLSGPEWQIVSFWRYLAYRLKLDKLFVK